MKGENFQMKPEEQRVLGILATIFELSIIFHRHRRIYLGDYRPYRQPQKTKNHGHYRNSSVNCFYCTFLYDPGILYANVYKEFVREFNRSYSEASASMEREEESDLTDDSAYSIPEEEEDDNFTWTQKEFDALIEGDLDNKGKGGTNYKDIIKKHGLPDSEFDSTIGGYNTRKVTYLSIGDKIKTVTLTFAKDDNGQLLLVQKHAVGLGQGKSKQQNDSESRV